MLEGLAQQIATLTRQARQAARYREIGEELRRSEGMLLFRRWREAETARAEAEGVLRERLIAAGKAVHVIGGADVAAELDAKRAIDQGARLAALI